MSVPLVLPSTHRYNPISGQAELKNNTATNTQPSLELVQDGLDILKKITKPVSVLSVTGLTRTGKSYFLSSFLKSKSFTATNSTSAGTVGIWIAAETVKHGETEIILLDVEGLDHFEGNQQNDNKLLLLTMMISSYFVYNSLGCPRGYDLEKLSFVCDLISKFKINSSEETGLTAFEHLPRFMWLLRDVTLMPTVQRRPIPLKEYILKVVLGNESKAKNNRVKSAILTHFAGFDCEGMAPPSADPEVLQNMQQLPPECLNPKFVQDLQRVKGVILSNIFPKRASTSTASLVCTGTELGKILKHYLQYLNTNIGPVIEDTFASVVSQRQREVVEKYAQQYNSSMQALSLPQQTRSILDYHSTTEKQAVEGLVSEVKHLMSPKQLKEAVAQLQQRCAAFQHNQTVGYLGDILLMNEKRSYEQCRTIIDKLHTELLKWLQSSKCLSAEEFFQKIQQVEAKYFSQAQGPAAKQVFQDFLSSVDQQQEQYKHHLAAIQGYEASRVSSLNAAKQHQLGLEKMQEQKAQLEELENARMKQQIQELSQALHAGQELVKKLQLELAAKQKQEEERVAKLAASQFQEEKQKFEMVKQSMQEAIKRQQEEIEVQNKEFQYAADEISQMLKNREQQVINVQLPSHQRSSWISEVSEGLGVASQAIGVISSASSACIIQ